ncbi:MAG: TetR/AcrR family transcriptional regulator [Oceanicoccus sp.]
MPTHPIVKQKYHHGDLAATLLVAAVSLLETKGPGSISLREVARVAGVSHGAPAHHFGDKTGLLTAVATDGHKLLAVALEQGQQGKRSALQCLIGAGEAYVKFAVSHPGHFSIMFQSDLIHCQSPDYILAGAATRQILEHGVRALDTESNASEEAVNARVVALWSQVHGFATLWLSGSFGNSEDELVFDVLLTNMLNSINPGF